MEKKKLILVKPIDRSHKNLQNDITRKFPPLGLALVAALTPGHWDIEIIDESFDEFVYKPADLVGITALTCNASRAYHIAQLYRKNNIHTVLGGIHATVLPAEAANYVDTVVIGEAENTWPQLISDFENGCIKDQYRGGYHSMQNIPTPRWDLYDNRYTLRTIQTSRGCYNNCDFCSIPAFSGNNIRYRPVNEVLDELERIDGSSVFFVDDNFFTSNQVNISRNIELFEGMIKRKLNKRWTTFAGISCADDQNRDVLALAAKSGCSQLYIGFESEDDDALKSSNKKINIKYAKKQYKHVIKNVHKHGIAVMAGIIYGFDSDDKQKIEIRTSFFKRSAVDVIHATTLTPFPGTPLYNRLKKENRLILDDSPENWVQYNFKYLVFSPKHMSVDEFDDLMQKTHKRYYNKASLKLRYLRTLINTKSWEIARLSYTANKAIANSYV